MVRVIDANKKDCIINEKYITAVHKYAVSNGNGVAIKILLCHAGYLGLWFETEEKADEVFKTLEQALTKRGWGG